MFKPRAVLKHNSGSLLVTLLLVYFTCSGKCDTESEFEAFEEFTTPQLIKMHGYEGEAHHMETSDGYILELHRILPKNLPEKRKPKVVFMQHCLLGSSSYFVLDGPKKSLGFALADQGYDVWLGNSRGNFYSRKHVKYNPDEDMDFWRFSIDEMGLIDLPESIDFILNKSNSTETSFIAHSQGSSSFFMMVAGLPEYNKKISTHISLAPVVFVKHMQSTRYKILSYLYAPVSRLMEQARMFELFPKGEYSPFVWKMFFKGRGQPAGTSKNVIIQYGQHYGSGRFQRFDYGSDENLLRYNSTRPPEFDLANVETPVWIFYTNNDWLADEQDVLSLAFQLPNVKDVFLINDTTFQHMDFMYGGNAEQLVYGNLVSILNEL